MHHTHNNLLLLLSAIYTGHQEARGSLKFIQDAASEVGMLERALSQAGMGELNLDGVLAAEEEYGFLGEFAQEDRLGDRLPYMGISILFSLE